MISRIRRINNSRNEDVVPIALLAITANIAGALAQYLIIRIVRINERAKANISGIALSGAPTCRIVGTAIATSAHPKTIEAQVIIAPEAEATCATAPGTLLKISSAPLCARLSSAWIRARWLRGVVPIRTGARLQTKVADAALTIRTTRVLDVAGG